LLNDYDNLAKREKIEEELKIGYVLYQSKLKTIVALLQELTDDAVIFADDYDYHLINTINTCIVNKDREKCSINSPLCAVTTNDRCQLVLPKQNLLTRSDNEYNYFLKVADELIRYSRIKSFMFEPQTYLSFGKLDYGLREDEIIMLQSLLTQEYFEGLVPATINKFVKYNSRDEAEPLLTQVYANNIGL